MSIATYIPSLVRNQAFHRHSSTTVFHCHPLLDHPPWLERDRHTLTNRDLFARSWIAGWPGFPLLHCEDAKVAKFNPALCGQDVDDRVERLLDDRLGFQLRTPSSSAMRRTMFFLVMVRFLR
jgi:hypothetical protein